MIVNISMLIGILGYFVMLNADVLRETQHNRMRPGAAEHLQPVAGFPS